MNLRSFRSGGNPYCPYECVAYDDLPEVTVSFWTIHVESRVGVVTPHFGRKIQFNSSHFSFCPASFSRSF